ncbi:MAG: 50S ribosomal protein L34 [Planctomycetes bacterium]|nr:50S ribosomal protein L34 [Planctomycetota bacterium]
MHTKIRRSKKKHEKRTGYRYRAKTHGGRNVIRRKRQRRAKGW